MGTADRIVPRGLIGVVHVPPLPGDPLPGPGDFDAVLDWCKRDADALINGGADAMIIENFGSMPFPKGTEGHRLPRHQVAELTRICEEIKARCDVPIGVNCLRNDAISALGIASTLSLQFIRVNVHTGAYHSDQGIIEGEAARSLRYRKELDAEHVAIIADILVKHAKPLVEMTPAEATRDALDRGHADGIIVTGSATGKPVPQDDLYEARFAAEEAPVYVGSGLRPQDVPRLAPFVDGAIVGTWLKENGQIGSPVDPVRVRRLATLLAGHFRRRAA